MNFAKIQLSANELQLALNESVILTKNGIVQKVITQWQQLSNHYTQTDQSHLPKEVTQCSPKISKGENYEGLPYIILDYPRYFTREDIFAIRTMFWWGHDICITLHLKGVYKALFGSQLKQQLFSGATQSNWFVQFAGDEWQHHYAASSHIPVAEVSRQNLEGIEASNFIKLVAFFPLRDWNNGVQVLHHHFQTLIGMLKV